MRKPVSVSYFLLLCLTTIASAAGDYIPSDPHDRRQILTCQSRVQAALTDNPRNAHLYDQLGYLYMLLKEYHAAERAFLTSMSLGNAKRETRFRCALAQYRLGHNKQALATLQPIIDSDDRFGEAFALRGRILRAEGNNHAALEAFTKAWSCEFPSAVAGYELARWEAARENYAGAVDYLRLAVLRAPREPTIRRFYADMLVNEKRYQLATRQWEILLEQSQLTTEANYRLAELYHRLGDPERAQKHLETFERIAPGNPGIAELKRVLAEPPGAWSDRVDPFSPLWDAASP